MIKSYLHKRALLTLFRQDFAKLSFCNFLFLSSQTRSMQLNSTVSNIYYCKDLHEHNECDSFKLRSMSDCGWKKISRKAIGYIRQWVDFNVFHHISRETDAYGLREKLEGLYERKIAQNKVFCYQKACEHEVRGRINC